MAWIDPEAGLTVTATLAAGDLSPEALTGFHDAPALFAVDAVLPASPADGVLFEAGGGTQAVYAGVRSTGTVFRVRAGTGNALDGGCAVLDVPVGGLPFDGKAHTLAIAVDPATGVISLYADQWLVGTATASDGALDSDQWSDGGTVGVGEVSGTTASGEPTAAWSTTITALRFYGDQAVIAVAREPDDWVYLAEITGRDTVFRVGTQAFSDPDGPGFYADAMAKLAAYRSSLEGGNGQLLGGAARVSRGVLTLIRDPSTDPIMAGLVAGRDFTLLRGPGGGKYWQFQPFLNGVCGRPAGFDDRIDLPILSRDQRLAASVIQRRLLGDNQGGLANGGSTIGLEGDESLKGRAVPRGWGTIWNAEPVVVNSVHGVLLIGQGDWVINSLKVKGVPRTAAADYADQASFDNPANAANAGEFKRWFDGTDTYVRLAGNPEGVVHVSISLAGTDADRIPAAIAKAVLVEAGETVDQDSVDALATAFNHVTGYYSGANDPTYGAVVASVLADAGAYFEESRLGVFRLVQLPVPDAGSVIKSLQRVSVDDPAAQGVVDLIDFKLQPPGGDAAHPVKSLVVKYRRNYRPLNTADLGGDPTLPSIDDVASPSTSPLNYDPAGGWGVRNALAANYAATDPVEDAQVASDYPLATDLEVETGLDTLAGAEALRALLFARLKVERIFATAQVPNTDRAVDDIQRGDQVLVTHPDHGFASGKPMVVIGITRLGEGGGGVGRAVELRLWG